MPDRRHVLGLLAGAAAAPLVPVAAPDQEAVDMAAYAAWLREFRSRFAAECAASHQSLLAEVYECARWNYDLIEREPAYVERLLDA